MTNRLYCRENLADNGANSAIKKLRRCQTTDGYYELVANQSEEGERYYRVGRPVWSDRLRSWRLHWRRVVLARALIYLTVDTNMTRQRSSFKESHWSDQSEQRTQLSPLQRIARTILRDQAPLFDRWRKPFAVNRACYQCWFLAN